MFGQLKERYLRWRIARRPIPDRLWNATLVRVPYARRLPAPAQQKLRRLATLFLIQKRFSPAQGLTLTDAMRVRIAVKACIPILELGLDYYDRFTGIVLYPHDFRTLDRHTDEAGVVHEELRELCGQALSHGPMVLSWNTIETDRESDGKDVVIHECAHKLDMLNGHADGFPPLHGHMSIHAWTAVFRATYDRLCADLDRGIPTRIDPYAAEDAAEFFAVTSETFFTCPDILAGDMPDVYAQLCVFYRQDPLATRS